MKVFAFATRNAKEILRDPVNLLFGVGFPLVLIFLLSVLQSNIPVNLFEIGRLTPGITVFGLSFMTLFSATNVAKDKSSSFLQRLYTTPLTPIDFILGYTLPVIPISVAQCIVCYIAAIFLGLEITINILYAVAFIIPISVFYIALGLLCGSVLNDKQVGGVCGALLTNLSAWLSGVWFDIELLGGVFKKIAYCLPFVHSVKLERAVLEGRFTDIAGHLFWVLGYATVFVLLSITLFLRQMKRN